jgi:hypothetical protein
MVVLVQYINVLKMIKKQLLFLALISTIVNAIQAQGPLYDYNFFVNSRMDGFYFFSNVISQVPSFIKHHQNKTPVSSFFQTPGNALQLTYTNGSIGNWQASIFKQQTRGQDFFKPANFLSCWIYADTEQSTPVDLPSVQIIMQNEEIKIGLAKVAQQNIQ